MATCLETAVKTKRQLKKPSMYSVVFINDDYTPVDLVVIILMDIFNKPQADATELAIRVHNNGRAAVGVFSKEIAEQKSADSMDVAREAGFPLEVIAEKA